MKRGNEMSNIFSVISGDRRNVELAKMLAEDGNQVFVYGLDNINQKELENKNVEICNSLEDAIFQSNVVIGPIPFSRDGEFLNSPLSNNKIDLEDFASWSKYWSNSSVSKGSSISELFFQLER